MHLLAKQLQAVVAHRSTNGERIRAAIRISVFFFVFFFFPVATFVVDPINISFSIGLPGDDG
jgi:hypothetical protein